MGQLARPISDASIGTWTTHLGGTASLFATIDEVQPGDGDFVQSEPLYPGVTTSALVVKLGTVTDPGIHTGHVVRYRFGKAIALGVVSLITELREGYVSEGQQGILIASHRKDDIQSIPSFVDGLLALTEAEAGLITNYGDLYLRWVAIRNALD